VNGIDVALSGRMATSGLMTSVDGALAVAHAITTHSVDADIDWFTAVDDLIEDEGDVGAGHLNTQEFSAGVFYRYASLNLRQLQDNLGGAPRARALEIGAHLLYLLATVVPSAKQQSFAAHNVADLVLASFSDMPLSLANAFENPIRNRSAEGYLKPSANALVHYWHKLQSAYGLGDAAKLFCLVDGIEVEDQAPTLQALQDWVRADTKNGE
jgi:CRISPR system Cascade subunit CasC